MFEQATNGNHHKIIRKIPACCHKVDMGIGRHAHVGPTQNEDLTPSCAHVFLPLPCSSPAQRLLCHSFPNYYFLGMQLRLYPQNIFLTHHPPPCLSLSVFLLVVALLRCYESKNTSLGYSKRRSFLIHIISLAAPLCFYYFHIFSPPFLLLFLGFDRGI